MAEFGFAPGLPTQQRSSRRAQFLSGRAVGALLSRAPRVVPPGASTSKTSSSTHKSSVHHSSSAVIIGSNHSSGKSTLPFWEILLIVIGSVIVVAFILALIAYWSKERKIKQRRASEGAEYRLRWGRVLRRAAEAAVLIAILRKLVNKLRGRRRQTGTYNQIRDEAVAAAGFPYRGAEEKLPQYHRDGGPGGGGGAAAYGDGGRPGFSATGGARYEPMAGQRSPGHTAMVPSPSSPYGDSGAGGEKMAMSEGGAGAAAEYYDDNSYGEAERPVQKEYHSRQPSGAAPAPLAFPAAAATQQGQRVHQNPHAMSVPAERRGA